MNNQPQTSDDFLHAAHAMERDGGHFAGHLARAYYAADSDNARRLREAFAELFTKYFQWYLESQQGEKQ